MLHDVALAADHETEPAIEAPDAAARAGVHIVNALGFERGRAADVIHVMRVAAVDQNVAGLQMLHERVDGGVDDSGWHHHPDRARLRQRAGKRVDGCRAGRAIFRQRGDGAAVHVVRDAGVTTAHQSPHHVRAHAPETDHADLHFALPSQSYTCRRRDGGLLFVVASIAVTRSLAKLPALLLIALILSPCTAPFQTYGLDVPAYGSRSHDVDVSAPATPDEAGSIITQATLFARWKPLLEGAFLDGTLSPASVASVAALDISFTPFLSRSTDPPD